MLCLSCLLPASTLSLFLRVVTLKRLPSPKVCNFSSQQVAHTGEAVAGDMECTGSSCSPPNPPTAKYPALPLFFQPSHCVAFHVMLAPCQVAHTGVAVAGTWSAQAAAALHPTHPQLKVAVAGDMECTGSSCSPPNPPAAKFLPCLSTPVLSCFLCCISCFFLLQTQASGSAKASSHRPVFSKVEGRGVGVNTATFSRLSRVAVQVAVVGGEGGSTPLGWGGRESIGLGRLSQGHVGSGEGGSITLGWDGKGEYGAGLSEASSLRHHGALHGSGRWS
ncbi:unnamed protein product [Closterium sp. NIES-65]|nr:unnamed protein product [Closterium sp. NIES-65]